MTIPVQQRSRLVDSVPLVRSFRPDVEGVRALAVLAVVLYHAGVPFLPGGFVGVDVFFVISGFLITTHLYAELHNRGGRISLTAFYARRARRLLPLAIFVALLTAIGAWVLLSGLQARQVTVDTLWTAFFAMNIHLAFSGVDYQAGTDPSPMQHYWSLGVEEQFYLGWPLFMLALAWAWRRSGERGSQRIWLAAGIGLVAVVSFAWCLHETAAAQSMAYFLTPARAWELGVGGLVALVAPWLARHRIGGSSWLATLGVAGIVLAAVAYSDVTAYPGHAAALPVLSTAAVLIAGLNRTNAVERVLLGRRPAQLIAKVSYGWYLWHWPLLVLGAVYFGDGESISLTHGLVLAGFSLWLATASYIAFENPLRALPALRLPRRGLVFGLALTTTLVLASGVALGVAPDTRGSGASAQALTITASRDLEDAIAAGATIGPVPVNLTPTLDDAAKDDGGASPVDGSSCHMPIKSSNLGGRPGASCVWGDPASTTTVVLTGDSHAYQWMMAMDAVARKRHWKLVSLTKSACPLYDVKLTNAQLKRDYTECYTWRAKALKRIRALRPAMIVTSSAIFAPLDGVSRQEWLSGVKKTVTTLRATGAQVVALGDTPWPRRDIPRCLAQHLENSEQCALAVNEAVGDDPGRRAATLETAQEAGAQTIDPFPWLCTTAVCPVVVGDQLVYRDASHLSATFSASLGPVLDAALPVL
ncbi:MAG: acyltransferase family protein [Janthinobacterium lividum]